MNHQLRSHALLGPSSLKIALNCSGSIALKQQFPIITTNKYAEEGTKAHELSEIVLNSFLESKISGAEVIIPETDDPTMLEHAHGYKQAIWENVLEQSITGKAYGIEERLRIDETLELWGTTDFWCTSVDDRARIYGVVGDFKYGFRYVSEHNNPQLAAYAVALRDEIRAGGKDLDYVKAFIYQPRADGFAFRETKFTAKQLDNWRKKFIKCAEDIFLHKKIKFKVGDWCKDCQQSANCELYAKTLSKDTQLKLLDAQSVTFPEVESISTDALINLMLKEKAISGFLKACKKRALSILYQGGELVAGDAGLKLVEGRSKRKWNTERIPDLLEAFRTRGIDAANHAPKGIGELETVAKQLMTGVEAKKFIDSYCIKTDPGVSLVSITDPRPAVKGMVDLLTENEEQNDE